MLPVVHINSRNAFWIVALIVIATLLPFLGETMFNSKGEPREAIVAVSMLNSGDWILPVSNGDVIPYKPPFMAWCVVLAPCRSRDRIHLATAVGACADCARAVELPFFCP